MIKRQSKQHIASLAVLLVFALFAVCVMSVLLSGAGAVRSLVQRDEADHSRRSAERYLTTRLRQADFTGGVRTEEFEGLPCIALRQEHDGEEYITRIYCYEGWLYELFSPEDSDLTPESGEKILPLKRLTVSENGDVLILFLEHDDASVGEVRVLRRSEGEAAE